jgi:hypothetical protein
VGCDDGGGGGVVCVLLNSVLRPCASCLPVLTTKKQPCRCQSVCPQVAVQCMSISPSE